MDKQKSSNTTILEKLIWLPVVAVILVIFGLSLQDGVVSAETSGVVTSQVARYSIFGIDFSGFVNSKKEFEILDKTIRTLAHSAEFMGLAITVWLAVTVCGIKGRLRFIYMTGLGIAVSLCDEFIQIFVPGRYCELKDVLCDFSGTLFISVLALIFTSRKYIYAGGENGSQYKNGVDDKSERMAVLGITINNISFEQAVTRIMEMAKTGKRKFMLTPNADHIVKVSTDKEFAEIYKQADLVTVDGVPIMWIAKSCSYIIKQRITGSDLFPAVCEAAAKEGRSLYILGAGSGVADKAVENLKKKYSSLNIVGTFSPRPGFENDDLQIQEIIDAVNAAKPDILVLALGSPKQEKFIYNYRDRMNFNIALPFGAAVDFVAGNVSRAPKWMRETGFEWLYRFLQEPGRLFRRYFIDDIKIFILAWKYRHEVRYLENDK